MKTILLSFLLLVSSAIAQTQIVVAGSLETLSMKVYHEQLDGWRIKLGRENNGIEVHCYPLSAHHNCELWFYQVMEKK